MFCIIIKKTPTFKYLFQVMMYLCLSTTTWKTYGEMEVELLAFLNSTLDEGNSLSSRLKFVEGLQLFIQ